MSMDPSTRQRLRALVRQQREVQRRIFAAQSAAIDNMQGVVDRLNAGLMAIREMQTEMLPLFENPNDLDDTIEGAGE